MDGVERSTVHFSCCCCVSPPSGGPRAGGGAAVAPSGAPLPPSPDGMVLPRLCVFISRRGSSIDATGTLVSAVWTSLLLPLLLIHLVAFHKMSHESIVRSICTLFGKLLIGRFEFQRHERIHGFGSSWQASRPTCASSIFTSDAQATSTSIASSATRRSVW